MKKKGFTLIEMIAAICMFTIVMLALMSLLGSAIKYNSINKKTYHSNINSKALFEHFKAERVVLPSPVTDVEAERLNGNYKIGIASSDDQAEIENFVEKFVRFDDGGLSANKVAADVSKLETFNGMSTPYVMGVEVEWDTAKKLYVIETWSWDKNLGNPSEVNRKVYLAPK